MSPFTAGWSRPRVSTQSSCGARPSNWWTGGWRDHQPDGGQEVSLSDARVPNRSIFCPFLWHLEGLLAFLRQRVFLCECFLRIAPVLSFDNSRLSNCKQAMLHLNIAVRGRTNRTNVTDVLLPPETSSVLIPRVAPSRRGLCVQLVTFVLSEEKNPNVFFFRKQLKSVFSVPLPPRSTL